MDGLERAIPIKIDDLGEPPPICLKAQAVDFATARLLQTLDPGRSWGDQMIRKGGRFRAFFWAVIIIESRIKKICCHRDHLSRFSVGVALLNMDQIPDSRWVDAAICRDMPRCRDAAKYQHCWL